MQIRDVMTSPVVTVTPDTSLKDAAAALVEHGINAVPVVADGRGLVGIVARRDLLRLVARRDQDIHADLERRLKEEVSALQRLGIQVGDGIVTFRGPVGPLARELAKVLAHAVPGVGEVRWEPTNRHP